MNPSSPLRLGILGCGDFLRWQADSLRQSRRVRVAALYDPQTARAQSWAEQFGARAAASGEEILDDPAIDAVALFVPPWLRRAPVERAAAAGKHIIATKPLGAQVEDVAAMVRATEGRVRAGVWYGRTGHAWFETLREILVGGEIGRLSLYKQDWIHHYPEWNNWALDPAKNGGPFMDAMIHNLNAARYLMGRPLTRATFFSDRHAHPSLPCADTEFLKADFTGSGSAHLFITWAADLAVYSKEGNDREHIDWNFLVTDQGWMLQRAEVDGRPVVRAHRGQGESRDFPLRSLPESPYDRFAEAVATDGPLPSDIISFPEAAFDIALLRRLAAQPGVALDASSVSIR